MLPRIGPALDAPLQSFVCFQFRFALGRVRVRRSHMNLIPFDDYPSEASLGQGIGFDLCSEGVILDHSSQCAHDARAAPQFDAYLPDCGMQQ
jgi:hypothetical protein